MSKLSPISYFLSPVSCDSLMLQDFRCEWGAGVLHLLLSLSISHIGHWKFNMTPHGKELSEDLKKRIVALHKDGVAVGYKKIAKTLKLSCSTVAKTYSGLTGQVPLRTGLAMVDQRSWVHVLSVISRGYVWKIDVWVLPALLQRLKRWGFSMSVLRPYAAHCIELVCMAVIPEGSLLWRWCTRKPANSLPKTSRLRTWITGTMPCGLMRPR